MKLSQTAALSLGLGVLVATTAGATTSHVVSGTEARLPMSLTTVIQDLEAEGARHVATAAFLTSRSVRRAEGARLLRGLFGIDGSGDHDGEVAYGTTTAFGKKLADDPAAADDDDDGGSGVAVACPACSSPKSGASASEVASTVVACGGTVVYVADAVDLGRGEGLFDYLGPALERLLAFRASPASFGRRPSTLVVAFRGVPGGPGGMAAARAQWEGAAARTLGAIIQPRGSKRANRLEDVFDRIEYVSSDERDVERYLCPAGGNVASPGSPSARGPEEISQGVSEVVGAGLVENLGPVVEMAARVPAKQACPRLTNPVDLAAARLLGPLAQKALAGCLETVRAAAGEDGGVLVPEFGALCDAAIRRALDDFDAEGGRFKKSPVARRIRADLRENLYAEMNDVYEAQLATLREASFASFRGRLNKLRISPDLPRQMADAAESSLKEFASMVKKLRVPKATSFGSWASSADQISSLRGRFAEHNAERLKAARASGQFKPVPRKGVTVGMHWFLPKPFGNDFRETPHLTHTAEDLVFAPVDGITDVGGNEIRSGDWRRAVVPAPSSGEMMYLK